MRSSEQQRAQPEAALPGWSFDGGTLLHRLLLMPGMGLLLLGLLAIGVVLLAGCAGAHPFSPAPVAVRDDGRWGGDPNDVIDHEDRRGFAIPDLGNEQRVLDVSTGRPGRGPLGIHLLGGDSPRVVGLERPGDDHTGADICAAAGINPWGLVWLFNDFQNAQIGQAPELLSDHPSNVHRVRALEEHFKKAPDVFGKFNSDPRSATQMKLPADTAETFLR
ncbi:MAG TPA: hypothetical protein VLT82_04920 [Myxococcaceae bacterium]|nr:hypothetical protein [Myxococcaceae bacterium]